MEIKKDVIVSNGDDVEGNINVQGSTQKRGGTKPMARKNKAFKRWDTSQVKGDDIMEYTKDLSELRNEEVSVDIIDNGTIRDITVDIEEDQKVRNDIIKAQETFFATVEGDDYEGVVENDEIYAKLLEARTSGAFIPIEKLVLLYVGTNGTKIFGRRVSKDGDRGEPVITFVYSDGIIADGIEIKMAELLQISYGNFGKEHESVESDDVKEAKKKIKAITKRLSRYWDFELGIRIEEFLKILVRSISRLKIDRENELDIAAVYSYIYRYVQEVKNHPSKPYIIRNGYYALLSEDMIEIVKILKQNSFLELQGSSVGYQAEVRGIGNCYRVRILNGFRPAPEEIVDFSGNIIDKL
jgi:hypothetical protein